MLPDDVFKAGEIAADPLEFDQPERYLGVWIHNGPLLGPRLRLALVQVGLGDVDALGVATEIVFRDSSFKIESWQDTIYGFNIVQFDGWPSGYLRRRLNQIGFIGHDPAQYNFESGWVAQGDDFQIIIDLLDADMRPFNSALITSFEWRLYELDSTLVLSRSWPEEVWIENDRWLTYVMQEDSAEFSGEYRHEVLVTLSSGELYTVYTGSLFFTPTKVVIP